MGALAAVLVIGLIHFAFEQEDLPFGLLLASTGTIYLGGALVQPERRWLYAELGVSLALFLFAWLGLLRTPMWLAAGYALHGGWDAAHHRRLVKTPVAPWFPPLSAAFDLVVAVWILWRFWGR